MVYIVDLENIKDEKIKEVVDYIILRKMTLNDDEYCWIDDLEQIKKRGDKLTLIRHWELGYGVNKMVRRSLKEHHHDCCAFSPLLHEKICQMVLDYYQS